MINILNLVKFKRSYVLLEMKIVSIYKVHRVDLFLQAHQSKFGRHLLSVENKLPMVQTVLSFIAMLILVGP